MRTHEVPSGSYVPKLSAPLPDTREAATTEFRRVADLVPHPAFVKHIPGHAMEHLSIVAGRGEAAFADPITITHENVILEGYALWQLAKFQSRATVPCIVRRMDQEAALLHLLSRNRGSKGIGDFVRILLALELEEWLRERAKSNQRFGGRDKGLTHLAEANRLDVRVEVARAAGVSAGNVSKVKHSIRYFGLLSPHARAFSLGAIFAQLGQVRRQKPLRLSWAKSIEREYGKNPLLDSMGQMMTWRSRR